MMNLDRQPSGTETTASQPTKISINKEKCKGCGYCVEFCPRGALIMSQEINAKGYNPAMVADDNKCVICGTCEIMCPEFAIKTTRRNRTK